METVAGVVVIVGNVRHSIPPPCKFWWCLVAGRTHEIPQNQKICFFRILRVRNAKGYGSRFVEGVVKLMLIVERVSG